MWDYPERGFTERGMKETVAHGGGSLSMFGIVTCRGFIKLVFIPSHISGAEYKQLLQTNLLPAVNHWPQGGNGLLCFMQDSASWHTATVAQDYLDRMADHNDFNLVDWPALSPDLNPLENVWAALKRNLSKFPLPPTIAKLGDLIRQQVPIFNAENQALFDNLYKSMPKQMRLVIKAEGAPIRY